MKNLTCKICGHIETTGNLIPHISQNHAETDAETDVKKAVAEYMQANGGINSVILPELQGKKQKAEKPFEMKKAETETDAETVSVSPELLHYIPEIDTAYRFPEFHTEVIYDINQRIPLMLIGHTGTGKTSLIEQIAANKKQPSIRANMNGQTSISDFVGFHGAKGGETYWIDGVLPFAMKNGLWLIIDEIDYADAEILSVLNAVLETNGNGALVLKENGNEIVKPHKDFRIFATANAAGAMSEYRGLYQGTNILNEAFLDRWSIHKVEYMPEALEAEVLSAKISRMPLDMATELVKVANLARQAFENEELACTFSTRRLINWAEKCIFYAKQGENAPFKAADSTIFSKVSKEDKETLRGLMSRQLLGKNP